MNDKNLDEFLAEKLLNEMASGSSREDYNNPGNRSFSTPLDIQANNNNKGKEKNKILVEIC